MKKVIIASLLMLFVLVLGSAFAGDAENLKDVGTMLYLDWLKPHETMSGAPAVKDFGRRGPIVLEARVDAGTALYNEAFKKDSVVLVMSGSSAGSVTKEDESTRIWDNLMVAPGGSNRP